MPNIHTKVGSAWKKVNKVHVNVAGVWKPVKRVWVNVEGTWKVAYSSTSSNAFVFDHVITTNTNNFNLRNAAIAAGWNQLEPLQATVTIASGIVVTSVLSTGIAFDTGQDFPDGTTLAIVNNGHIRGKGGKGGAGSTPTSAALDGDAGGIALRVQYPTSVTNNGTIAGGGGGGAGGGGFSFDRSDSQYRAAGGGGGSGANGFAGGAGGTSFRNDGAAGGVFNGVAGGAGTETTAGVGGTRGLAYRSGANDSDQNAYGGAGGAGGGLGQPGSPGVAGRFSGDTRFNYFNPTVHPAGVGGSAGAAVQGNSAITWVAAGTRLGPVNG